MAKVVRKAQRAQPWPHHAGEQKSTHPIGGNNAQDPSFDEINKLGLMIEKRPGNQYSTDKEKDVQCRARQSLAKGKMGVDPQSDRVIWEPVFWRGKDQRETMTEEHHAGSEQPHKVKIIALLAGKVLFKRQATLTCQAWPGC